MTLIYLSILMLVATCFLDFMSTKEAFRTGDHEWNVLQRFAQAHLGNHWPLFSVAVYGAFIAAIWITKAPWLAIGGIVLSVASLLWILNNFKNAKS